MLPEGTGGRLRAPPRLANEIWVRFTQELRHRQPVFCTEFVFPGAQALEFIVPASATLVALEEINGALRREMTAGHEPAVTASNLVSLGESLTEALLHIPAPGPDHGGPHIATAEGRAWVASMLARHSGPVLIDCNLPFPVELLTFETQIRGVGAFDRVIGGRPNTLFISRQHAGRPLGAGAAYFHDVGTPSAADGTAQAALERAFPAVLQHGELLHGQMAAAKNEIDRLLRSASTWAHFQCHSEPSAQSTQLRLTKRFLAGQKDFRRPNPTLTAVLLNTCSAAFIADGAPEAWGYPLSWVDYFNGDCGIPAAIGPFCDIVDADTIAFTEAFYDHLKASGDVPAAFAAAREQGFAQGDFAPLIYRYLGPPELSLPQLIAGLSQTSAAA